MPLLSLALAWALAQPPAPEPAYTRLPGVEIPAAIAARLAEFAAAFQRETGKALVITDGTRDPAVQASRMLRNLDRGDDIVRNYANKSAARVVRDAYVRARRERLPDSEVLAALTAVIRAQVAAGDYVSKHLREGAVDVRTHDLTRRELGVLRRLAAARDVEVVDETRTATPHYHLNFVR